MKYKNLIGKEIQVEGFAYFCVHWRESDVLGPSKGANVVKIYKHEICTVEGPLFGQECVFEKYGSVVDNSFIYPVTELERLGRIPEGCLNNIEENYQIY